MYQQYVIVHFLNLTNNSKKEETISIFKTRNSDTEKQTMHLATDQT
jgi:hypothetical protein